MRSVSDKSFRESRNTHFKFNNVFPKLCHLWDVEKYGTARQVTHDSILRRMRFACWLKRATSTHSEYVILIAFLLQHWLHERASMLSLQVHIMSCFLSVCCDPVSGERVCRIFMKFGMKERARVSWKSPLWQSHFAAGRTWTYTCSFNSSWPT